jgi:AbrB family looped-hinge helix DNA binding protein
MGQAENHIKKVTTKGQVTIPVEIRRLLGLEPHDKVVFRVEDGKVEMQAVNLSLRDAFGAVKPIERPENFRKLRDEAIEEHVQKVVREMRQ